MTGGFFAILDDIAALLDDTAVMSKIAVKKVGGVLGDDLAVGAERAAGFAAKRELPVIWAITKGSVINKFIILPFAFLLSAFAPWAIVPILMLGAAYLSFEGAEKAYEYLFPHAHHEEGGKNLDEKAKIKSAIRTDFILSIEIVVIGLGTVAGKPLLEQIVVTTLVALAATAGVYGVVALMVRMDDMGYWLMEKSDSLGALKTPAHLLGRGLVAAMPRLIKALGYIGTVAMLLVGGGIFLHHTPWLHHLLHGLPSLLAELAVGITAGALLLGTAKAFEHLKFKKD